MAIEMTELQERFDAEQAKGYRGATVDPNPNSAYSQETDPMTSPRAPRHGSNFLHIDEFADPNNPEIDNIHGRSGLSEADIEAAGQVSDTITVAADATGTTGQTTVEPDRAPFDGVVEAATLTPTETITGDATNYRTFTLRNVTKGENLGSVTTEATKTGGTAYPLTLDGTPDVSEGDELSVVETVAGTGVAHAGATVSVTFQQTDTA